jgi:hypothetical protein
MKDFTRVCRIEPQAVGAWIKQTRVKSVEGEIESSTRGIHDIFPTTTKKKR